ncbi:MAG: SIR2 family protein [Zhaonellaceae bacterium]|jgi:hypothetical protein
MKNILKVRDDHNPFFFESNRKQKYIISDDQPRPNWLSSEEFSITELRGRIEPWLTALFQSEHLSLLAGSGLSTAIQYVAVGSLPANRMRKPELKTGCPYVDKIHAYVAKSARENGRGEGNIEDYFRVINNLLHGLAILDKTDEHKELKEEYKKLIENFTLGILEGEKCIIKADEECRTKAFNVLTTFLMSFASRTGTRERLNIFTTNYDRVIEAGAELAGLHLLDRFVGMLSPIFRSSRLDIDMHYNPPGIRGEPRYLEGVARFTKLHGSIDWVESGKIIRRIGLPFGASDFSPHLSNSGLEDSTKVMIYPNSSKDRETAEYPYVELFRDFASAICRPNSTLVTYGYGFGDEHINRVIRDMLTIPSTHLVIISYDEAQGRIMRIYDEIGRASQISLLVGQGLADIELLTEYFLPKPAIDRTTIRMSELLMQRYNSNEAEEIIQNNSSPTEGGAMEK